MQVRLEGQHGNPVPPPAQVIAQLASQLQAQHKAWLQQLAEEPGRFAELEGSVHSAFQHLAAQLVASLLAQASQQAPALEAAKKK